MQSVLFYALRSYYAASRSTHTQSRSFTQLYAASDMHDATHAHLHLHAHTLHYTIVQ